MCTEGQVSGTGERGGRRPWPALGGGEQPAPGVGQARTRSRRRAQKN